MKLAGWYRDVLKLEISDQLSLPDDTGIGFSFPNGTNFWIGQHDQVHGKNKDPYRNILCFNVKSANEVYEELSAKNVEFIRKPSLAPTGDLYVATAVDPEGNLIQFESVNP